MSVRFEDNKILFNGNAVAMHEDCCCCATPCDQCPDNCGPPCFYVSAELQVGPFTGILDFSSSCYWSGTITYSSLSGTARLRYYTHAVHGLGWHASVDSQYYNDYTETVNFTCQNGGTIIYEKEDMTTHIYTFTPCGDCDDCPPA